MKCKNLIRYVGLNVKVIPPKLFLDMVPSSLADSVTTHLVCMLWRCLRIGDVLRPVYTGDFCRGNSMQFLSH